MVKSCLIAKWSGIPMPFEYRQVKVWYLDVSDIQIFVIQIPTVIKYFSQFHKWILKCFLAQAFVQKCTKKLLVNLLCTKWTTNSWQSWALFCGDAKTCRNIKYLGNCVKYSHGVENVLFWYFNGPSLPIVRMVHYLKGDLSKRLNSSFTISYYYNLIKIIRHLSK